MSHTWLITGGSSGIGLALAREALSKGHKVVATTRDVEKARGGSPDIEEKGGHWLRFDYTDANVNDTIKGAVEKYNVDILVNNAGYANVAALEDTSLDAFRAQYEANVVGPFRAIQATIPALRARKSGVIVNVGSSVSYAGLPALGIYGSTKAALRTITEGLVNELAPFGIRTLLIEPGQFRTNFGQGAKFSEPSEAYKEGPVDQLLKHLLSSGPSPGDAAKAAQRIFEIVTGTGMASSEDMKSRMRFPLGKDSAAGAISSAKQLLSNTEAVASISNSTDHDDVVA